MLEAVVEVERPAFRVAIELTVAPGERVALFGPSGAGKTTVLEAIAGLQPLDRGHVRLEGQELTIADGRSRRSVPVWRRGVVLLRQQAALFPHLDVRANLAYAGRAAPDTVRRMAERLEVDALLRSRPARLSGGQAQRVALGRALLSEYRALLLDEPYTGLDARLRTTLTLLVREVVAEQRVPALLVAHELEEAQAFADRLGIVDRGRLLQLASPHEVVRRPATRRVAELVGYRAFVPCGGRVLAVHPERVVAGAHPGRGHVLAGRVTGHRPAGARFEVDLQVGETLVVCRLDEAPACGDPLEVTALDPPVFEDAAAAAG